MQPTTMTGPGLECHSAFQRGDGDRRLNGIPNEIKNKKESMPIKGKNAAADAASICIFPASTRARSQQREPWRGNIQHVANRRANATRHALRRYRSTRPWPRPSHEAAASCRAPVPWPGTPTVNENVLL